MSDVSYGVRRLQVRLPQGEAQVARFEGRETISDLFNFHVELRTPIDQSLAFDALLAKSLTVEAETADGSVRYWNGIVAAFREMGAMPRERRYLAELRPSCWLLTKRRRSRIFQDQSTLDILRDIFSGFEVKFQVDDVVRPRGYCVQYRESDFDFASRLMEEDGLSYSFSHAADNHAMVISGGRRLPTPLSIDAEIGFDPVEGGTRSTARVRDWMLRQEVASTEFSFRDHSFQMTGSNFESRRPLAAQANVGARSHRLSLSTPVALEVADYPGGYAHRYDGIDGNGSPQPDRLASIHDHGQQAVQIAAEREASASIDINGVGDSVQFTAGRSFTLKNHGPGDGAYLLTQVEHQFVPTESGSEIQYKNSFHCIPADLPYRPGLKTPRPTITGGQTATVAGRGDEEIVVDPHGRIKVRFHWDRSGDDGNGSDSCWLRVVQSWAGQGWGAQFLPRAGQEVFVGFIDGDPDQPIVVGSVYNNKQPPPFDLPNDRSIAGLASKSRSGEQQRDSAILFDDRAGGERLGMHAGRDMIVGVENNQSTHVGGNYLVVVGKGSGPGLTSSDGASDGASDGSSSDSGSGDSSDSSGGGSEWSQFVSYAQYNMIWAYGPVEYFITGSYVMGVAGNMTSVTVGTNIGITIAASLDVNIGPSLSYTSGWNWDYDKAKAMISESEQDLVATTSIGLTAGTDIDLMASAAMGLMAGSDFCIYALGTVAIESATSIDVSASSIAITGNVSFEGNVDIKGKLGVVGSLSVQGPMSLQGDASIMGKVAIVGNLTVNGIPPRYF